MAVIRGIDTVLTEVVLKQPFRVSREVMDQTQPRVFVRVNSDNGFFGLGEAAPLVFFNGESAASIKVIIDEVLAPSVVGSEALDIRALILKMDRAIPGNNTAKTALEIAFWDLAGKLLNLPVYRLLGGKVRQRVPVANVVSLKERDQMVKEALDGLHRGYDTLKIKLTANVEEDYNNIRAIREAVGSKIKIRADANSGYSVKDALKAVKALEPFDLEYLEQPCDWSDPEGLKEIRDRSNIPIAADESLMSREDALKLITARAVDWFVIKLIKVGGIMAGLDIATLAHMAGIKCTFVSPIETSVGAAAGIHLAVVMPAAVPAHELNGPEYLIQDPSTGVSCDDVFLTPGELPGLGVSLPGIQF